MTQAIHVDATRAFLSGAPDGASPGAARGASLDREVASRMYGSYSDRLASAARRRGELAGAGALGAIPAVELATPAPAAEAPSNATSAGEARSRVRREGKAEGSRAGSRAGEGGAKNSRAATGPSVKADASAVGATSGNQASPEGAGDDGIGRAAGGAARSGSAGALARLASAGSGARAIVALGASSGTSAGGTRVGGGTPGVGIGAQRVRGGAFSTTQRMQSARPAQRDALIEQVQRGLAKALQSKDGDVTVRLRPENLGLVKVRVRVESARVTAALEATSEQARELLSQNVATLERALEARGLSVDRVVVEHVPAHVTDDGSRQSQEHWGGASPRAKHGRSPSGPDAERPEEEPVSAASEWAVGTIHIDAVA